MFHWFDLAKPGISLFGATHAPGAAEPLASSEAAALALPELLRELRTSQAGLSSAEAAARLAAYGQNVIATHGPTGLLIKFLGRFRNPLVLILIAAAGVSALTGDVPSFVIITIIVLMSVILDVVQEHRAEDAAEALRKQVSLTAQVFRDGRQIEVEACDLVPGDVISLAAGDLIPADCRLIEARDLYVNEALLTGEPYPAEKEAVAGAADHAQAALLPRHQVFMGSSVVSGTAKVLIVVTGKNAQLGSIAGALQKPPPPTAFAIGVRDFGLMIVRITIFLVLFTLLVNLAFHRPPLESFLFALALAVGLTPELLPMVISVTLAHGAMRMARKQVIVKRLSAIHDLGSMDILCSDKTGTLTDAKIKLVREVDLAGHESDSVMQMAELNAAFETGIKSPLDEAILAAKVADLSGWTKIDEVPFDFERRRVSVLLENGGRRLLVVKGAPEDVLRLSSHYAIEGSQLLPLDAAARETAEQTFAALSKEGFRVLGVASRDVEAACCHACVDDESALTFTGFLAFLDPPKEGAKAAIAELAGLGVTVKVVTGDNEQVTRHVCCELGLDIKGTLTGPQIEKLGDDALKARLDDTTLFCRVTPQQKSRIIRALRNKGHVVGYLGDGINDAPSLHAADVGFSVDTAVDVAKEAASMILLRKDLDVLAEGVREGRRTYANILKYVMMGTSSNFGNMFSMAGGVIILPFLPMLPIQILLNNLLYDFSETAIPLDYVDEAMVAKPRRWDLKAVQKFMFIVGPLSSIFDFVTFWLLLHVFKADETLFHTSWFVESMATQVLVIFIIRTAQPFRNLPHPALAFSSLAAVAIAVLIPFTPLGTWFGFVPLSAGLLGALALTTLAYLGLVYIVRRWFFHEMA
jgi:P-type Mg2+ transporter